MIAREVFSIKADSEGKAEKTIDFKGVIEKIEIIYSSLPRDYVNEDTRLVIYGDDGKKILDRVGDTNNSFYVRTETCDLAGASLFKEGNVVLTRFLVGENLRIELEAKPETLIEAVIVYYEPLTA